MLKRKRIVLTIKDKCEIIKRLEEGESAIKLSKEYNVGKSTITDIKKQKISICNFISQLDSSGSSTSRRTMKLASNIDLEDAVYKWFTQKRSQGEPISGQILCEKAIEFNEKLEGSSNFRASAGWLKRFKTRHGIGKFQMQGDRPNADSLQTELKDVMKNYALENVYNADETGLNWKALPQKIIPSNFELAAGSKLGDDRITVLACANATGSHRLPILIIGKSKKPSCFKHVNICKLPIVYASEKNAWIDNKIFMEWFTETFIPSVIAHQLKNGKRKKTLLILDYAPTHPSCEVLNEKDEFINVIFIPPNETVLVQPLDQGIMNTFKRYYRKELLRKLLLVQEESLVSIHNSINLKDASHMIGAAWGSIKEQDLKIAWNKVLCEVENPETAMNEQQEDMCEILNMLKKLSCHECDEDDVLQWMGIDDGDPGYQIMQDSDIVNLIIKKEDDTSSTNSENETIISASEAFTCLNTALHWFEAQPESDYYQISVLKAVRDLAARKQGGCTMEEDSKIFIVNCN